MDRVLEGTPELQEPCDVRVEDWGVEDWDISSDQFDLKPKSLHTKELRVLRPPPLTLTPHNLLYRRRVSFIKSVLCLKITKNETSRFLEQFQYTIVSSGLLEKQPVLTKWSLPSDIRRTNLLFDFRKPWVHLYTESACQVAAGAGTVAVALLLHLRYRRAASRAERALVCAVITAAVVVYAFSTAKQRLLRSLRKKALVFVDQFVERSKTLDGDCARAISDIQTSESAAFGYMAHAVPPSNSPVTAGTCKQLRAVLANSLLLLQESLLDAVRDLLGACSPLVLEQFFEIYGLPSEINELGLTVSMRFVGFDETDVLVGKAACYASPHQLKRTLGKFHLLRRVLLCCLLSLNSSGVAEIEELEKWTVVCDQLLTCSGLMQQISPLISKERLRVDYYNPDPPASKSAVHPLNAQSALLADASATAKLLNARVGIVYDSDASPDLISEQLVAVETEIMELQRKWAVIVQSAQPKDCLKTVPVSYTPSPTLIMTPACDEFTFDSRVPDLEQNESNVTSDFSRSFEGEAQPAPAAYHHPTVMEADNKRNLLHFQLQQELTNVFLHRS